MMKRCPICHEQVDTSDPLTVHSDGDGFHTGNFYHHICEPYVWHQKRTRADFEAMRAIVEECRLCEKRLECYDVAGQPENMKRNGCPADVPEGNCTGACIACHEKNDRPEKNKQVEREKIEEIKKDADAIMAKLERSSGPCRTCWHAEPQTPDKSDGHERVKCTNPKATAYHRVIRQLDQVRKEGCYEHEPDEAEHAAIEKEILEKLQDCPCGDWDPCAPGHGCPTQEKIRTGAKPEQPKAPSTTVKLYFDIIDRKHFYEYATIEGPLDLGRVITIPKATKKGEPADGVMVNFRIIRVEGHPTNLKVLGDIIPIPAPELVEKPCPTCAGHDEKTGGCDILGGAEPLLEGDSCAAYVDRPRELVQANLSRWASS